ncbi:hypothetical protein SACE_6938 [Saccharopolyspora erythraea NRRL 2338]|uniref:DUF3093 family protein n=2 Tax=Saccharopolyspora erythraea TaxID=1836 RepID=A4FPX6_SACEN|nr:hypothetical protein N599_19465 [Saccharopolyspora erythraea D]CAM06101.1 hypothetical protein SACE_6938 [Saccharopolyspora erythraea NRRL 2338]
MSMTEPVLYAERGASWWPVLWGPAFALVGVAVELLTPGPRHLVAWLLLAGALAAAATVWVYGRRKVCSVRLTPTNLAVGREVLEVERIAAATDVGAPVGARVLGGGWTAPKGTGEVPLRLTDDRVVLAWARDPESLVTALRRLLREE